MPSKEIAEKRYKEGKCTRCGSNREEKVYKTCINCRNRNKQRREEKHNYHTSEAYKIKDKIRKQKRVKEGKCIRCGRLMLEREGVTKCINCMEGTFWFRWD
jgi:hypothetical protein